MKILSFEQEFERACPGNIYLIRYMREAIGVKNVEWEHLTTLNLSKVREHICSIVNGNSACTYLAIIKAFLSRYADEGIVPCKNPKKELKAKKMPSQNVYLTEEEIDRIEKYEPKTFCEQDVKAAFLIECYLGARRSDVENLTDENIVDGRIVYVSKKTHTECSVPIHKKLLKYLQYKQVAKRARSVTNRTIQRICKEVGITQEVKLFHHGKLVKRPKYEFVGSHTARRSFCSNLAKRGVDIYTIAALAGHRQNIIMTQRYVVTDMDNISDEAMKFFNG